MYRQRDEIVRDIVATIETVKSDVVEHWDRWDKLRREWPDLWLPLMELVVDERMFGDLPDLKSDEVLKENAGNEVRLSPGQEEGG